VNLRKIKIKKRNLKMGKREKTQKNKTSHQWIN